MRRLTAEEVARAYSRRTPPRGVSAASAPRKTPARKPPAWDRERSSLLSAAEVQLGLPRVEADRYTSTSLREMLAEDRRRRGL